MWDTSVLDGYPWVHLPNRSPVPGIGRFFGLINPGIWGLIRKGRFDAAILPGYFYFTAWIAIAAAKWYGTPILFVTDSHSLRSWNAQSPWKLRFKKWMVRGIFSLGDAVMVSSSGGVEYLKSLGFSSDRIFLVPTAVDNDWWTEQASKVDRNAVRATWSIPMDATVALFCAKLQRWKGPLDLLEAFARANVPNSYLVYAGDGPERRNLESKATELGLADRVRFLGFVNQSQLPASYSAADLFVLPSLFEPFGLVVNEAMLCGLPVAVSDRVGAKFDLVLPDENGYVFPAGDVDALAGILRKILPDPEKRARMGAAARRRMETWSPRSYADSIVRAVQTVKHYETGFMNSGPPAIRKARLPKENRLSKRTSIHLDAIRGVSALAVMLYHLRGLFFVDYPFLTNKTLFWKALYAVTGYGHQAVIVFFVLSGYFIGASVMESVSSLAMVLANISCKPDHQTPVSSISGSGPGRDMGPHWNEIAASLPRSIMTPFISLMAPASLCVPTIPVFLWEDCFLPAKYRFTCFRIKWRPLESELRILVLHDYSPRWYSRSGFGGENSHQNFVCKVSVSFSYILSEGKN